MDLSPDGKPGVTATTAKSPAVLLGGKGGEGELHKTEALVSGAWARGTQRASHRGQDGQICGTTVHWPSTKTARMAVLLLGQGICPESDFPRGNDAKCSKEAGFCLEGSPRAQCRRGQSRPWAWPAES